MTDARTLVVRFSFLGPNTMPTATGRRRDSGRDESGCSTLAPPLTPPPCLAVPVYCLDGAHTAYGLLNFKRALTSMARGMSRALHRVDGIPKHE